MLSLRPANPAVVARWRAIALGAGAASGGMSIIGTMIGNVQGTFPDWLLQRYPEYQSFMYAAVAFSLVGGGLLLMVDKVIAVSFAQLGAVTGWVYIGYALVGVFSTILLPVFVVFMACSILVVIFLFGPSLVYFLRLGAYADMALGGVLFLAAMFMCAYPLYVILQPTPIQ
jgi:hypothetical protein